MRNLSKNITKTKSNAPVSPKVKKPKTLQSLVTGYHIFSDGTGLVHLKDGSILHYEVPNTPMRTDTPEFEAHLARFIKL